MRIGSQGAHSFSPGLDLTISLHSVKSLYLPLAKVCLSAFSENVVLYSFLDIAFCPLYNLAL